MLRQLLVPVIYSSHFLTNSKLDESVLRAAHRALMRHQNGITDAFLFIVCDEFNENEARNAIAEYGFPDVSIVCINTLYENGEEIDDSEIREDIDTEISRWLRKYHPAALPNLFHEGYESLDMWWTGIEAIENSYPLMDEYAQCLPDSHISKANTWLAILAHLFEFDEGELSNDIEFGLIAASLCQWLQGFERVSGNSFNDFEAESVCRALGIEDFILGFFVGQYLPKVQLDEILHDNYIDDREITEDALKDVIERKRSTLRDKLSRFFGDDRALLWALHTTIWPKFNEPSEDACNYLVSPYSTTTVAEIINSWMFVTDGWADGADR